MTIQFNPVPFVIGAFAFLGVFSFTGSLLLAAQVLFCWLVFVGVITVLMLLFR